MDNKDFKKNSNFKVILIIVAMIIVAIIMFIITKRPVSSNQYKDSYQDSLNSVKFYQDSIDSVKLYEKIKEQIYQSNHCD